MEMDGYSKYYAVVQDLNIYIYMATAICGREVSR